jgi:polysaccharide pyruvyl transferase CsaB
MKILMTLMGLDIGGAETHVMELARSLQRKGHQVVLASNGGVYVPQLEECGVRHVTVPMHQRDPKLMLQSLGQLKRLIQAEQPDLVHAHARIPAFLCGILQKQLHFPLITSAHWVFEVTPLLRIMTNWGERTVAVSQDIKHYLMVQYQVPEDQIHVTVNGIDTEAFAPITPDGDLKRALGLGDGPVICAVSRLDESRALAAWKLLGGLPRLLETYPAAQVLLVGGGDQEMALRQRAEALNQQYGRPVVVMTGPRTDIPALVALSTVFVGVSRAALEAMAAGKPAVLAGNEGYIGPFGPAVLALAQESNFCCRGCPQVTEDALLQDLLDLLGRSQEMLEALGAYGRQVVQEHYSVERMTQDYLVAYQRLLQGEKPLRAVISGYYGYRNLGDDAILLAVSRQLSLLERPVRLTVLSRHPRETRQSLGLPAIPRFSPWQVFRALRRSDLLISGGGSLLQDRTSARSLRYYLGVIRLAQWLGKPVCLYANGIGPLRRPGGRRQVRQCLVKCTVVTLRDQDSLQALRELGVQRTDMTVTADPAFSLSPKPPDWATLKALGIPGGTPLLGVSLRAVPGMEARLQDLADLCDRLCQQQHRTIVFVAMQSPEDEVLSRRIQERMQCPSYLATTPGDPEAMLGILRCMDALLAMRLHGVIFAATQGVPTVGLSYDPKVTAFLELLGLPCCGTLEDFQPEVAYDTVADLLQSLETYRQDLAQRVDRLRVQAAQVPEALCVLLKGL